MRLSKIKGHHLLDHAAWLVQAPRALAERGQNRELSAVACTNKVTTRHHWLPPYQAMHQTPSPTGQESRLPRPAQPAIPGPAMVRSALRWGALCLLNGKVHAGCCILLGGHPR